MRFMIKLRSDVERRTEVPRRRGQLATAFGGACEEPARTARRSIETAGSCQAKGALALMTGGKTACGA